MFIVDVLKPEGKTVIPQMVKDLMDNPIGNPILKNHWEQTMTVHFQKTGENDNQVLFGEVIHHLKDNIYKCMKTLWNQDFKYELVQNERCIRYFVNKMIDDELYVDEEAMIKRAGSKKKITDVKKAAKQFLKSICYIDDANKNTIIPDIVCAFRKANT